MGEEMSRAAGGPGLASIVTGQNGAADAAPV